MTYFYPDLGAAIHGQMDDNGQLKNGQFAQLVDVRYPQKAWGLPMPRVRIHDIGHQKFNFDASTSIKISSTPLLRDPYEQQTCYISPSGIHPQAGEGLFAKRYLPKGSLVAIFNGVRKRQVAGIEAPFSHYKICLARGIDLDIPDSAISAKKYCATIAHKACHSFTPNAAFQELYHPR